MPASVCISVCAPIHSKFAKNRKKDTLFKTKLDSLWRLMPQDLGIQMTWDEQVHVVLFFDTPHTHRINFRSRVLALPTVHRSFIDAIEVGLFPSWTFLQLCTHPIADLANAWWENSLFSSMAGKRQRIIPFSPPYEA